MKRFILGEHRGQGTLLPESLDDYVSDTNPVRVVDVFVDELNLVSLGFDGAIPADTGRPAYHPAVLLKIYIYGYLNRIQSSRRLSEKPNRSSKCQGCALRSQCTAFPDAKAGRGKCREELERARLQLETGHEDRWSQWFDEGAVGQKRFVLDDLDSCRSLLKSSDAILINYGALSEITQRTAVGSSR